MSKTIEKGYLGSLIVEKSFIKNEFNIFKPVMENGKVDMIIEKYNVYLRLQIKTIQTDKNGKKTLPVRKISHNMGEYKIKTYNKEDINYFIGVDLESENIYIVPIEFSSKYSSAISISTLEQFKNNFNLMELYSGNIINEEDNIGETLTCNDDGNTEGIEK